MNKSNMTLVIIFYIIFLQDKLSPIFNIPFLILANIWLVLSIVIDHMLPNLKISN